MSKKQKKFHYIYKTTNVKNGKFYIGMHSTNNLNDGYMGSGKRLWNSIKYHGKENHVCEILEYCDNRKDLAKREEQIVNEILLNEDLCMNLRVGGSGGFMDEEHMMKCSRAGNESFLKKMKENKEFRANHLKKLKENGSKKWENKEVRDKILANLDRTGIKHSDETKQKISQAMKGKGLGGENSNAKPVVCYDLEGNLVKVYQTMKAAKLDGFNPNCVSDVCRGKQKSHRKHIFKFYTLK